MVQVHTIPINGAVKAEQSGGSIRKAHRNGATGQSRLRFYLIRSSPKTPKTKKNRGKSTAFLFDCYLQISHKSISLRTRPVMSRPGITKERVVKTSRLFFMPLYSFKSYRTPVHLPSNPIPVSPRRPSAWVSAPQGVCLNPSGILNMGEGVPRPIPPFSDTSGPLPPSSDRKVSPDARTLLGALEGRTERSLSASCRTETVGVCLAWMGMGALLGAGKGRGG